MSVRSKTLLAFSLAAAAAAALMVAAPPAFASGQSCNDNGNWTTCISVDGSGNFIDYVSGYSVSDNQYNGAYNLPFHVQMVNPNGVTLCNSPTRTNTGESVENCFWQPEKDELTGNYCLITWVYNGEYHNVGEECFNVWVDLFRGKPLRARCRDAGWVRCRADRRLGQLREVVDGPVFAMYRDAVNPRLPVTAG